MVPGHPFPAYFVTIEDEIPQLVLNIFVLGDQVEQEAHGVGRRVHSGQQHVRHQRQDVLGIQMTR